MLAAGGPPPRRARPAPALVFKTPCGGGPLRSSSRSGWRPGAGAHWLCRGRPVMSLFRYRLALLQSASPPLPGGGRWLGWLRTRSRGGRIAAAAPSSLRDPVGPSARSPPADKSQSAVASARYLAAREPARYSSARADVALASGLLCTPRRSATSPCPPLAPSQVRLAAPARTVGVYAKDSSAAVEQILGTSTSAGGPLNATLPGGGRLLPVRAPRGPSDAPGHRVARYTCGRC